MNELAEMLERELEEAAKVKNKQALHRYAVLLSEYIDFNNDYEKAIIENSSEIKRLAELLEHEFQEAIEIKSKQALHRFVVLLAENIVRKNEYEKSVIESKSEIRQIVKTMKEGFKAVDKRFKDT